MLWLLPPNVMPAASAISPWRQESCSFLGSDIGKSHAGYGDIWPRPGGHETAAAMAASTLHGWLGCMAWLCTGGCHDKANFYWNFETIGHLETRRPASEWVQAAQYLSEWVPAALYLCKHLAAEVATTCGGCINVQTNFYQNFETIGHVETRRPGSEWVSGGSPVSEWGSAVSPVSMQPLGHQGGHHLCVGDVPLFRPTFITIWKQLAIGKLGGQWTFSMQGGINSAVGTWVSTGRPVCTQPLGLRSGHYLWGMYQCSDQLLSKFGNNLPAATNAAPQLYPCRGASTRQVGHGWVSAGRPISMQPLGRWSGHHLWGMYQCSDQLLSKFGNNRPWGN